MTLTKEDGTGKTDANTYADVADGDAFHEGHLYASAWSGATTGNKETALVMATRLIDALCYFRGFKTHDTQALQWPRELAKDDNRLNSFVLLLNRQNYFANDVVPVMLINATIETARALIEQDRTTDPDGEGIAKLGLVGTLNVTFDKQDRPPIIPHVAQAMLARLGELQTGGAGTVRFVRV